MRSSFVRILSAGALAALFAGVTAWTGREMQAQNKVIIGGGVRVKEKNDKEKKDEKGDPLAEDDIPFAFPYDRDAKKQLEGARDYLEFKEIPWNTVCPLLQNILEARSDSFFNVKYTAGGLTHINRISVKTEANRIIAAFKPEGLEFYQQLYGQTASAQLDEAVKANYDIPRLADVSQRYFHTKAGAEATVLLGTLYLERGNYLEAAYAFERLLSRPNVQEFLTPRTLFKACLAMHRSGDSRHGEMLKTTLASLQKATLRDGLAIGRKKYTFDQLRQEIDRPLELLRVNTTVGEWAMPGGNAARAATVEGGAPFLSPIFRSPMLTGGPDEAANTWIKAELDKAFERKAANSGGPQSLPLPGFFPVTTADTVMFRTYDGIYNVAARDHVVNGRVIRAGELLWRSKASGGVSHLMTEGAASENAQAKQTVLSWWGTYFQTKVTSILYENPLLGSLSHDGQNLYFVDDIAIPPPPTVMTPEFGIQQPQVSQSGELGEMIRAGQLTAIDQRTGKVAWNLGRTKPYAVEGTPPPLPPFLNEDEADKTTSAFQLCLDAVFLGPPLPLNGKLYALIEQAGVMRLLCLDPKLLVRVPGFPHIQTPTLVWSQKLGRPNNTFPQDSVRRFQGATPVAADGIIICPTNSGAVVAVDAMSHSLLWAYAYRKVSANDHVRNRPTFQPDGRMILPDQLQAKRWRASGPIIASGRVLVTAYDSTELECLDLRTGKLMWSVHRDSDDLYVGGVVDGKVIVVGQNCVKAYHVTGEDDKQQPKAAFEKVTIPNPTGHGIGAKGVYYVPVRQTEAGTGSIPPAEIWAIDMETGRVTSKPAVRKRNDSSELTRFGIGNLIFQNGQVFAQSAWELACYPQLEQKKAEMDRLLAANPKDPVGLLNRGELLLDDGKLKEAIADFNEAEKNNLPEEKQPLLRDKKYVAYTELLRTDFGAGEKYLEEYKRLCEVPPEPGEDAEEKVRREDEMNRRHRWREFLLAKGRESQGRLDEAFDHYMALANMGEAKTLMEMPDEPSVRMRPDVWARGRIESMLRRAGSAEARASLVGRVQKKWGAVKGGNDLRQLREFVSLFGPYFDMGVEAQFLLTEKLLETNNEADNREAQTHLAQLRAMGETPLIRARATERLARLMIANQMMEDAVGLYLQLGREYPTVAVRDGKTGTDFVTQLLTDKRLLPFLEPSRYPMPSRVKALQREPPGGGVLGAQFEIEPSGDLYPVYRRCRFTIDQFAAGNGTWTIRAIDRATGAERCRFSGLMPPQMYNPGSIPFSNFVQASGQLLLVQLGSWVYCLDLNEKKERWQKNLLGDPGAGPAANPPIQNPDADGEVTVMYDQGYVITLGKAAVLQAGYAALLTRDGLEVVEPLTRRLLWTRKGIATGKDSRTQLYGDARSLVLVEVDGSKRPLSTRVLRALDGSPVEGSPNLGRVLATAKSYQIIGCQALLTEGDGDQPRVLRLIDLTTGKDVWKKTYDAHAIPIKSLGRHWAGFISPEGEAEVIDLLNGRVEAKLKIDPKNVEADLKPCQTAQLLHDAERFYLILDRNPSLPSTNGTTRQFMYNNTIRTQAVNGPIYAFDRATGKRLWNHGQELLENQMLILEQFSDLPVIIAAGPMMNNRLLTYPVVIIEKSRGRLVFNKPIQYNGNFFQSLTVNMKNGTVDLNRFDLRIEISPEEPTREP